MDIKKPGILNLGSANEVIRAMTFKYNYNTNVYKTIQNANYNIIFFNKSLQNTNIDTS